MGLHKHLGSHLLMEEQEHIGITEEYRDLYQLPQNKEGDQLVPRPTQLLVRCFSIVESKIIFSREVYLLYAHDLHLAGPQPNARNNNVTSSGFKRQITVDPATFKENTTRYSGMPPSSRPSTANAPSTKGVISPGSTHTPTPDTSRFL